MTATFAPTPPLTFPERPPWSGVGLEGWDGTKGPDDLELVSASSIPKVLSSPALDRWHVNETINRLLDNLPTFYAYIQAGERDACADWIKELRYQPQPGAALNAADSGTAMHSLLEAWLNGVAPEPQTVAIVESDPVLVAMATNLWTWFCRFEPELIEAERVVYDPATGIAGRFDAIVRFRKAPELGVTLLDLKNAREARYPSGGLKPLYGDAHALQLACYRHAPYMATFEPRLLRTERRASTRIYLVNRAELEACAPMIEVQTTAVVKNDPERCQLHPIDTGEGVHRRVREAVGLWRWVNQESRDVVGAPFAPAVALPSL